MKWDECVRFLEQTGVRDRFTWPSGAYDFNCVPGTTISDVTGGFKWLLTWPGDWVLSREPVRLFLEIQGPSAVGHWISVIVGIPIFLLALGLPGLVFGIFDEMKYNSRKSK